MAHHGTPDDRPSYDIRLDSDPGSGTRTEPTARRERTFRMAVIGDFSGRENPVGEWRVDRDDFDEVLRAIAPTLRLQLADGMVVDVVIRELDDFHPDQLFTQVPQFARLRALRTELANPSTFSNAAAELSAPPASAAPRPVLTSPGSLLDSIIGDDGPNEAAADPNDLYAFIQRAIAPILVARPDPRQAELVTNVDGAIATLMRAVLHHPALQSLEALWRGVFRLVRQVDTDERLQVHLVDMNRDALLADLQTEVQTADTATSSGLSRRLVARAPRDEGGWALLAVHHAFGSEAEDIAALARLSALGAALDAPCLAEALPTLALGDLSESAAESWRQLRESRAARYLGLAIPRVLLRLPYGHDTDAIEQFVFEELETPDAHGSYLWGNPSLFCAALLAQGFTEHGAALTSTTPTRIGGLPLHVTRQGGQAQAKSCAEVVMRHEDAMALQDAGFIPMCALRDEDVVHVPRIQSIAEPLSALAGSGLRT